MRVHTRLGASILLTLVSLVSIILLLPPSRVTASLHIALGSSIDEYAGGLWTWVRGGKGVADGVAVVVFGDSWADGVGESDGKRGEGNWRGRSWAGWMCEELNCTAYLSFAASQPAAAYPASPPAGAVTSKLLYASPPAKGMPSSLPDLATQVQEFLSSKAKPKLGNTLFAVSSGFWDIYHFAGLDYELAQNITDASVDALVAQVHILYTHYTNDLYARPSRQNASTTEALPPFQLAIPKLFDPSLVPGWLSQRSVPPSPSTVAEQQKQAVYLTQRWNSRLENALGSWVTAGAGEGTSAPDANSPQTQKSATLPRRDVFYYDLPKYVLDVMVEHQLEVAGQKDASGLGTGQSPFASVSEPCLREGAPEKEIEGDGVRNTVCADPESYLFWDEFNLGGAANEEIGKQVAALVKEGSRMGG